MIEQPKKSDNRAGFGVNENHPAYAQISASRVSGRAVLYGSNFIHQNYIRVRIAASTQKRNLSDDSYSTSGASHIEVEMSEAQWATFVSAMNVNGGTPCTLRRLAGEQMPELPMPESKRDQFKEEAKKSCQQALDSLEQMIESIKGMAMSAKAKKELIDQAITTQRQMISTLPFVLDQFGEHMEHEVEKAKIEINTHHLMVQTQAGQMALSHQSSDLPAVHMIDLDNKAGDEK